MRCDQKNTKSYMNAWRDSAVAQHHAVCHPGQPANYEGGILQRCKNDHECQIAEAYWVKKHKDGRASINRAMENNGINDNIKI